MFSYNILSCTRFCIRRLSRSLCNDGVSSKKQISITFIKGEDRITIEAEEGQSVYNAVVSNNLDLGTFGECSGQTSCSTCHVIVNEDDYKRIKELGEVEEKEADLLDNAYSACSTSRLACQIIVTKDMDGLELSLPGEVKDARLLSSTYTSENVK